MTPANDTSTRRLIQELAEIEDRKYYLRATRTGARETSTVQQELLRLAGREEDLLAQLRRRRVHH
jgi:sugar (pentulose or hexulose) kinase